MIPQMEPYITETTAKALSEYVKDGGWMTEHVKTCQFEDLLKEFTGAKHCFIMPNGTLSLSLALKALGVGPGDEVIVPAYTMLASASAINFIGAKPIFCDIEPDTLCMEVESVEEKITPKTKAIMYVAINGRTARSFDELKDRVGERIPIVEDAAQALGSTHKGKHVGLHGNVGSLSFSAPKIITTGQGGALITNDDALARSIKRMRDFGRDVPGKDEYISLGWNLKFSDLQAVVGIEQMQDINWRVARKKEMWSIYEGELAHIPEVSLISTSNEVAPWFYDILIDDRERLMGYLLKEGISTRKFYPLLIRQGAYFEDYGVEEYPVAEEVAIKGLWLPSSLKLTDEQIYFICSKISQYYGR